MSKKITTTVLILCFSQVDVSGSFFFELDAPCLIGQYEASLASSLSRIFDAFALCSGESGALEIQQGFCKRLCEALLRRT